MTTLNIPGFEILEKLGVGGMATVWKARQVSLDRIVAIKVLSARFATDPSDVQMFQAEAQAAAKLKHPGIVQVYDANVINDTYYFVMEYVAGYTIGDWLRRKGVLSEHEALLVAECVADALSYAWSNAGIIHCDIKPDNVMVDADGTVKVADLGLARTINAMGAEADSQDIMGTPAYISPEQAQGSPDLDFRADIYSLGAMLYHLLTGKLMFEGEDENTTLELQVTGTVPDPIDINHKLSQAVCWLIEKMLAKSPDARHESWEAVQSDIDRVKRRLAPTGRLPAQGVSTVERSPRRTRKNLPRETTPAAGPKEVPAVVKMLLTLGVVACIALGFYAYDRFTREPQRPPAAPAAPGTPPAAPLPGGGDESPAPADTDAAAHEMYEFAVRWAKEHPQNYEEAIEQFNRVSKDTRGTKYALMAEQKAKELSDAWQKAYKAVMDALEQQAAPLIASKNYGQAAAIYTGYSGAFAADTDAERTRLAEDLQARQRKYDEHLQQREEVEARRLSDLLDGVAEALLAQGLSPAKQLFFKAEGEPPHIRRLPDYAAVSNLFWEADNIDSRIIDSFRAQRGQTIKVGTVSGDRTLVIGDTANGRVQCQYVIEGRNATATIFLGVDDLSTRERLARMGSESDPATALLKGIMAYKANAYEHARGYFGKTHALLADRLQRLVQRTQDTRSTGEAKEALSELLESADIATSGDDPRVWVRDVRRAAVSSDAAETIKKAVAAYRQDYGTSPFIEQAEPVLEALENIRVRVEPTGNPRQNRRNWRRTFGRLQGDAAIVYDILQVNPQVVNGEVRAFQDEDGTLYRIDIVSPGVSDISPLADTKTLREVTCGSMAPDRTWEGRPPAQLADISPLRGLPLQYVYLGWTQVKDLEPLRGAPLKKLLVPNTQVSDIDIVKSFQLEALDIQNTHVRDISDLRGQPLRQLNLSGTRAYDFRAIADMLLEGLDLSGTQFKESALLRGMPLRRLNLANTRVYNFDPLAGMELESLNLEGTQVKDISFVRGMPLIELFLSDTGVGDISPAAGMQLERLSLNNTTVKDFDILTPMPLRELYLEGTRIDDLSVIASPNLETLKITDTKVKDLSPLRRTRLHVLSIRDTDVEDLSPLSGMALKELDCRGLRVKDWSPLMRMPIERIWLDNPGGNVKMVLRSMPNLRELNGQMWWRW